jgi:hypothetical protein
VKLTEPTYRPIATKTYHAVIHGLKTMQDKKYRTARQICGNQVWGSLSDSERRFAGRFISAAVSRGMFGLTQAYRDSSNHWRYKR